MWFAVPFTLATTLGLTGLALDLPLSAKEVASGLVPPAVAYHLFGKGGVILITIMVFMAGAPALLQATLPLQICNGAIIQDRVCSSSSSSPSWYGRYALPSVGCTAIP